MTAICPTAVHCSDSAHDALKRNPNALYAKCKFLGYQRDEGFPPLMTFDCPCGQTLQVPVASAGCQFCTKDPGVWRDCCREMRVQLFREQSSDYERKQAVYAVECAREDERLVG